MLEEIDRGLLTRQHSAIAVIQFIDVERVYVVRISTANGPALFLVICVAGQGLRLASIDCRHI